MKNKNKTSRPGDDQPPRTTASRQQRQAHRLMPKAPHHDLLVLGFYPGMGAASVQADHPNAA